MLKVRQRREVQNREKLIETDKFANGFCLFSSILHSRTWVDLQAINESWGRVSNIYSNFTAAYIDLEVRFENHKKCKRGFREMFCSSLWPQRKETALTREGGTLRRMQKMDWGLEKKV